MAFVTVHPVVRNNTLYRAVTMYNYRFIHRILHDDAR